MVKSVTLHVRHTLKTRVKAMQRASADNFTTKRSEVVSTVLLVRRAFLSVAPEHPCTDMTHHRGKRFLQLDAAERARADVHALFVARSYV